MSPVKVAGVDRRGQIEGLKPTLVAGLPDWTPAYGATPVVGMAGGIPLSGTLEKALINMQQAKLLREALAPKARKP